MSILGSSRHWYWPVMATLIAGYLLGGVLPVGIHYFGLLGGYIDDAFRPLLYSILIGALGANVSMSIHFAREQNDLLAGKSTVLPSCFEWFGYLLKLVWGGIAAAFFVIAVKVGFLAAVGGTPQALQLPAVVVISFCAGLRAYEILRKLGGIIATP
ncbi:MAG: hypothetical protein ACOY82_03525 [Pseudomonadota bacterium]